jgi:predicted alpha-1,6-mannanase (GH76 family)
MNLKRNSILFLTLLVFLTSSCQKIEDVYRGTSTVVEQSWEEIANKCDKVLIDRFWNSTGYFNDHTSGTNFQYWPQAHAIDVLIDAYERTGEASYAAYFDQWYNGVRMKNWGSYYNDYNDDMAWITLSMIRLYKATKDQKYLNTANDLWTKIVSFWNTEYAGGGVSWKNDQPWAKNACINGPAALIAAQLYQIDKDEQKLEWSIKIFNWLKKVLVDKSTGAVFDNIDGRTNKISRVALSYNQATYVGTAYLLYQLTSQENFLLDARKASIYGVSNSSMLDVGNNIIRDEGSGDGALFKGIFMRYYSPLCLEKKLSKAYREKFYLFLKHNAEVAWTQGQISPNALFSANWVKPAKEETSMNAQVSACTLFEALSRIEKAYNK